jgi:predicted transcriptional regulator
MPRRAAREIPPPLELECLDVLWRLGESNVRTVQEALAGRRPLAYTTVTRRKIGRHFVYTPEVDRDTVRRRALRQLLDSLFDGSRDELTGFLSTGPGAIAASVFVAAASPAAGPEAERPDGDGPDIDAVLL